MQKSKPNPQVQNVTECVRQYLKFIDEHPGCSASKLAMGVQPRLSTDPKRRALEIVSVGGYAGKLARAGWVRLEGQSFRRYRITPKGKAALDEAQRARVFRPPSPLQSRNSTRPRF